MSTGTVDSILRASQAYCGQLCEKETLTHGICYYGSQYPNLAEANQFREVVADETAQVAEAFAQAEEWFTGHGLRCLRWVPAAGVETAALTDFLPTKGFAERRLLAMMLANWPDKEPASCVRILPARAMRDALSQTFAEAGHDSQADACAARLDDPQFDMFVAIADGEPVGRCALHQVGDIACIVGLTVLDRFSDRGIDDALLHHVISLAKRLNMRRICLQTPADDSTRTSWLESWGFATDGVIVEYHRTVDATDSISP